MLGFKVNFSKYNVCWGSINVLADKELIFIFSKATLNCLKVTLKIFILQKQKKQRIFFNN